MVFSDLTYQQEPRLRRQKRSLNFWKRILRPYLTQNCISQSRSNSLVRKLLDVSLWADIKKMSAILRRGCDDEKGDSAIYRCINNATYMLFIRSQITLHLFGILLDAAKR